MIIDLILRKILRYLRQIRQWLCRHNYVKFYESEQWILKRCSKCKKIFSSRKRGMYLDAL